MRLTSHLLAFATVAAFTATAANAQSAGANATPAPAQAESEHLGQPEAPIYQPRAERLPEQYLWIASPANPNDSPANSGQKLPSVYFRKTFTVASPPAEATLYTAGPGSVKIWLNGKQVDQVAGDPSSPLGIQVFTTRLSGLLKPGRNTVAIEVTRGFAVPALALNPETRQIASREVLVAKLLPAPEHVPAEPILISDASWKGSAVQSKGWEAEDFNDSAWISARGFGAIESNKDVFPTGADAGLYAWPGYDGAAAYAHHTSLGAKSIVQTYLGRSRFVHPKVATPSQNASTKDRFEVKQLSSVMHDSEAPSVLLDYGQQLTGRIRLVSVSDSAAIVLVQMGDSLEQAANSPQLGAVQVVVPPHGTAFGPISKFRYARIRFLGGAPQLFFKSIDMDVLD